MASKRWPDLVAIGASAGGIPAVLRLLEGLDESFPAPIVLIEHNRGGSSSDLSIVFQRHTPLSVKEAESGEVLSSGSMYIAPGDYHLLVEKNGELSLSVDDKVNWCRPSIDVFFESAALAYKNRTLCIVLTGANRDGALGAKLLRDKGAKIMIQDPAEADFPSMPQAAADLVQPDRVYRLDEINKVLMDIQKENHAH